MEYQHVEKLFTDKILAGENTADKQKVFLTRLDLRVLVNKSVEAERKIMAQRAVAALVQSLTSSSVAEAHDQAKRALSPRPLPSPEILKALDDLNRTVKGLDE